MHSWLSVFIRTFRFVFIFIKRNISDAIGIRYVKTSLCKRLLKCLNLPHAEDEYHFKSLPGKICPMILAACRQNKASLVSELAESRLRPERHSDMNMNVSR